MTTESYLNRMPPEIREIFILGLANLRESKKNLAGFITTNQANTFTKEQLLSQNIRTLKGMVGIIPTTNFDYKVPDMPKTFELNQ